MSKKTSAPKKEETTTGETKTEARPQKIEKTKKEKSKRQEKGVHALYKLQGETVSRLRPTCERCGPGYFMGDHKDRYTCGHCGFTRYKTH